MNIILHGMTNAVSLNFIILTDRSSQPCALLGFSDLMIFGVVSSEMIKSFIRGAVPELSPGISLSVPIVVHRSMN